MLLILTGKIAEGCNSRLNSNILFFKIIKCLTILTPPDVEPAEAPTNISRKKIIVIAEDQEVKSTHQHHGEEEQ